ncbi:hypothetical protein BKA93DRAFT_806322 [Sparassis latifolia]
MVAGARAALWLSLRLDLHFTESSGIPIRLFSVSLTPIVRPISLFQPGKLLAALPCSSLADQSQWQKFAGNISTTNSMEDVPPSEMPQLPQLPMDAKESESDIQTSVSKVVVVSPVAYINRIPNELLRHTFEVGFLAIDAGHWTFTRSVASICTLWRDIALDMSLLWTKVPPLTLDSPLSPDTLDIWLPHARHRTLDFDLFAEGFNEDAIQAVIGALTSHANRWRSMEIYTNRFSAMIKVSASLPSHAGNLEQLILNCGAHDDLHDPEIIRRDNDVLRMKAPRLRNLYLEDFPCVPFGFLFHRYFPKLERLDLVGSSLDSLMIPGNDPYARRPSVLMKTLTALPHLRYLRIASLSLHGIYEATPETDRAILPALQEVEFKDAHLEHTITVLEAMEAPQLRFMSCIYPRSDDDFDDESPIMHDHLHHFPRFRMLKVIPDRTFTVNEYLSRFVGDFETVDFICAGNLGMTGQDTSPDSSVWTSTSMPSALLLLPCEKLSVNALERGTSVLSCLERERMATINHLQRSKKSMYALLRRYQQQIAPGSQRAPR